MNWMKLICFTIQEIRKVVSQENSVSSAGIYNKHMLHETDTSIASMQAYAVHSGLLRDSRCILHDRIFKKTTKLISWLKCRQK